MLEIKVSIQELIRATPGRTRVSSNEDLEPLTRLASIKAQIVEGLQEGTCAGVQVAPCASFRPRRGVLKNLTHFSKIHLLTVLAVCKLEVFGLLEPTVREARDQRKYDDVIITTETRRSRAGERNAARSERYSFVLRSRCHRTSK